MLNPKSPVPLYHQLADILLERIRSGIYTTGQMIPSETGLAQQYGIGRPTVRQAMETLVQKGVIQRRRGAGTFVKYPAPQVDLFSLAGTSQAFLTKGIPSVTRIIVPIASQAVLPDPDNPFSGGKAFFLSRLTLAEDVPVLLEDIFLDAELFMGIDTINLENKSLSQIVSDFYYLAPENATQLFRVESLDAERAGWLNLKASDPVLSVRRTLNFPKAPNGIFSVLFCRTDRFSFSQTLQPGG